MLADVKLPWAFFDDEAMLSGVETIEIDLGRRYGLFSEMSERASTAVNVGWLSGEMFVFGDEGVPSDTAMPIIDSTSDISSTP
jgi:hypothetical protein